MRAFFIDNEGRLRTGWRLLVFGALLTVLQIGVALLAGLILDTETLKRGPISAADPGLLIAQALGAAAITLAVYIASRWLDRRSFTSLGLERRPDWLTHLIFGTVLGIGLQALIFIVELAAGWLVIEQVGWRGPLNAGLGLTVLAVLFVIVAWNEELLTRGYLLQNLEHGLGTIPAVALSSLVFGALHIFNENATVVATLGVAFAGLLLAVAYLVTRALWLPIGLHLGWNYGEGPIFGFPVSGLDAGGLLTHRDVGPEVVTGGAFGPEAGLISIAAEIVGIVILVLWWQQKRRGGEPDVPAALSKPERPGV